MNNVIHEGMPEASFTISFNCLADLVSKLCWNIIILLKALEGGLGVNFVHFMDFMSNLDSHTGPDSKYN